MCDARGRARPQKHYFTGLYTYLLVIRVFGAQRFYQILPSISFFFQYFEEKGKSVENYLSDNGLRFCIFSQIVMFLIIFLLQSRCKSHLFANETVQPRSVDFVGLELVSLQQLNQVLDGRTDLALDLIPSQGGRGRRWAVN